MNKKILLGFVGGVACGVTASCLMFAVSKNSTQTTVLNSIDHELNLSKVIELPSVAYNLSDSCWLADDKNLKYTDLVVKKDFNGDKIDDKIVILAVNSEGSGTFYYVTGTLSKANGYYAIKNSILLGDRIVPQSLKWENDKLVVKYKDRKPNESFSVAPSVEISKEIIIQGEELMVLPREAKLFTGKPLVWLSTKNKKGVVVKPKQAGKFTISLQQDQDRFNFTTDCNNGFGTYQLVEGGKLSFGSMGSTQMFCANSQETEFVQALSKVVSYSFNKSGELVLGLADNEGEMIFK